MDVHQAGHRHLRNRLAMFMNLSPAVVGEMCFFAQIVGDRDDILPLQGTLPRSFPWPQIII